MSDTTQLKNDPQQQVQIDNTQDNLPPLDYKCERVELEGALSIEKLMALSNSQARVPLPIITTTSHNPIRYTSSCRSSILSCML